MDDHSFKQCPNGHYYQGEECPYCNAEPLTDDSKVEDSTGNLSNTGNLSRMKVCPHDHAYNIQLDCCPYCGETRVTDYWDMCTSWFGSVMIYTHGNTLVQIDGKSIDLASPIEISYLQHRYITGYEICGAPPFNYRSVIKIGQTVFSGKEFINLVEFASHIKEIKPK